MDKALVINFLYHGNNGDLVFLSQEKNPPLVLSESQNVPPHPSCMDSEQRLPGNRLKMNENKTEFVIFGSKQTLHKCQTTNIHVGSSIVKRSSSVNSWACLWMKNYILRNTFLPKLVQRLSQEASMSLKQRKLSQIGKCTSILPSRLLQ